jgi:hypothetical protein
MSDSNRSPQGTSGYMRFKRPEFVIRLSLAFRYYRYEFGDSDDSGGRRADHTFRLARTQ